VESTFGVSWFAHSLQPAELLASLADLTRHSLPSQRRLLRPSFRPSRSPFSPSDISTVASGHLHRQDSHLLERQLASLHERNGFELPVPLVFLSNRGFSGSFVFSVGANRRSRRKRNGQEASYFRLNRRNRQFESIPLRQRVTANRPNEAKSFCELTAYGRIEDKLQILTAGFDGHAIKPVEPAELTTLLCSLIAARRGVALSSSAARA